MSVTVQAIMRRAFPAYAAGHRLPLRAHQAAGAMRLCRTGELGWHVRRCPEGHVHETGWNSCRHRSCPQCGADKAVAWLERCKERLLPCPHFHVIFTVAHELLPLWRYNRRVFGDALFRAVRDTLFQLLAEDRHLGAHPGVTLALHTWGGLLQMHPHIHALVTAGGLGADGSWRPARKRFLLWVGILRTVFLAKLLDALRSLLERGELVLPPNLDVAGAHALLKTSAEKTWNVQIEKPYAHGRGVALYLARYVRGGPIKNHRLNSFNGEWVTFSYREHRTSARRRPCWKEASLPAELFVARLLEHVPVNGFHMVRSYGLYAGRERERRERARAALHAAGAPASRQTALESDKLPRGCCPICGATLVLSVFPAHVPPLSAPCKRRAGPRAALKSPLSAAARSNFTLKPPPSLETDRRCIY